MIFDRENFRHPWAGARSLVKRLRADSLLRNSACIMGANISNALSGYMFWVAAVHIYSPFDIGLASAFISIMLLAAAVSNLGISSTLVQLLPGRSEGKDWSLTLNAGGATGIVMSLLAGIIVVGLLPLFSRQFTIIDHEIGYTLTLVFGIPITTLASMLDQTFVAERASVNMLLRNLVVAALKILLMILPVLLLVHLGALGIFLAGVLATAISLLGGWIFLIPRLGRAYRLTIRGISRQVRSMLSSLAGNHFINLGGLTPVYLLPVFVTILLSPTDNAYYFMADKLDNFFFMVSSVVAVALFAEGSHRYIDLPRKVRSSVLVTGMVLAPSMLLCFFGGRYVLLLFGPDYAQHSLLLLRIDAVAAVPDAITNIYVSMLRVQGRLRFAACLSLGMAALTLVLAWILLPGLGIAGAGWAILIAQTSGSLVAAIDAVLFHRRIGELDTRLDLQRVWLENLHPHISELDTQLALKSVWFENIYPQISELDTQSGMQCVWTGNAYRQISELDTQLDLGCVQAGNWHPQISELESQLI